jgi:hypothetical protein
VRNLGIFIVIVLLHNSASHCFDESSIYGKEALKGLLPYSLAPQAACVGSCFDGCAARSLALLQSELERRQVAVVPGGSVSLKLLLTCSAGDSSTLVHGNLQLHAVSYLAHSNSPSSAPLWDAWFLGVFRTPQEIFEEVADLTRRFANDYKLYTGDPK